MPRGGLHPTFMDGTCPSRPASAGSLCGGFVAEHFGLRILFQAVAGLCLVAFVVGYLLVEPHSRPPGRAVQGMATATGEGINQEA